ncbi:AraC family transcriptional regulator [Caldimonas tepidiphila]|uniref:AraC family transcriptional regulator n=1 Tax=Caldimonas tepidiphila TaxID=2315841 RepID=UPI000E5BF838|nr:helix-turn-helix domain-containing protein [Caldimonas tepidiphila]
MHRYVPAPADLRAWIRGGVVIHRGPGPGISRFPALTTGMITVRLRGEVTTAAHLPLPRAAFVGPGTRPAVYRHVGPLHAVGLIVQAAALPCLLGTGAAAAVDTFVPMLALYGPRWADWEEQLERASGDEARLSVLFRFVRQLASLPVHAARRARLEAWERAVCRDLAEAPAALGMSLRQLERRFGTEFGMSPKRFQRVDRVAATLYRAMRGPVGGAELALAQGFYDQSHMARDLRQLAGHPLQALMSGLGREDGDHWPLSVGALGDPPQG